MSKKLDYRKGARVIVETCMGIKQDEKVLIITSRGFARSAKLIAEEAEDLGANVAMLKVSEKEMQIEPPEEVAKKMLESDVILGVLSHSTIQLFLHMNARRAATDSGARVGGVTVKPSVRVWVPPGVVTETSLALKVAAASMVMLAAISVGLTMVKLLTVIPSPKLTVLPAEKLMPVMVTSSVTPWVP